eukprot:GHVP01068693.1.p1 GENE.GHVP01068693.1~~GHVP01068693.1.p1  ORF type:complete len:133 (+),score=18.42 GHVP01068693.1:27-425(+)
MANCFVQELEGVCILNSPITHQFEQDEIEAMLLGRSYYYKPELTLFQKLKNWVRKTVLKKPEILIDSRCECQKFPEHRCYQTHKHGKTPTPTAENPFETVRQTECRETGQTRPIAIYNLGFVDEKSESFDEA